MTSIPELSVPHVQVRWGETSVTAPLRPVEVGLTVEPPFNIAPSKSDGTRGQIPGAVYMSSLLHQLHSEKWPPPRQQAKKGHGTTPAQQVPTDCGASGSAGQKQPRTLPRPHMIEIHLPKYLDFRKSDELSHVLAALDFGGCPWLLEELYGWDCQLTWRDQGWGNSKGRVGFVDAAGTRFVRSLTTKDAPQKATAETCHGNFPTFKGMTGLAENMLILFAKIGGGGGHELHIHQLRVRIITRSGVAYSTLNMLHLVNQLKGCPAPTSPQDVKKKGRDQLLASSALTDDERVSDGAVQKVILSLASTTTPVPQEVLEAILSYLYLPLAQMPELFHVKKKRTDTLQGSQKIEKFDPEDLKAVQSKMDNDSGGTGPFLTDYWPYYQTSRLLASKELLKKEPMYSDEDTSDESWDSDDY